MAAENAASGGGAPAMDDEQLDQLTSQSNVPADILRAHRRKQGKART
jgi:hypothetical protein